MRTLTVGFLTLAVALTPRAAKAQGPFRGLTLTSGTTILWTEHTLDNERESLVTLEEVAPTGVRYLWRHLDMQRTGDTASGSSVRTVSAADLAGAPRLHVYYADGESTEHPGYTAWSLSTAVFRRLRTAGSDTFQIMRTEEPLGQSFRLQGFPGGGRRRVPIRWRGSLIRRAEALEPFPLLLNGRRTLVPALRVQGRLVARGRQWNPEFWVLADSVHPLLLKWVGISDDSTAVMQMVRVDLPVVLGGGKVTVTDREGNAGAGGGGGAVEADLAAACRVELPGVYFAFNSAELDPASDRALASTAAMLARHPDWQPTIEGHTDSVGTASANRVLSLCGVRRRCATASWRPTR